MKDRRSSPGNKEEKRIPRQEMAWGGQSQGKQRVNPRVSSPLGQLAHCVIWRGKLRNGR